MALAVSEDAQSIDGMLRSRASNDSKRFAHLSEKAEKRKTEPQPAKKMPGSNGWSENSKNARNTSQGLYAVGGR